VSLGSCDDKLHSTFAYLQTDADFSGFIVDEVNAGLFRPHFFCQVVGDGL